MSEHKSADGHPVTMGARLWDNDLHVVEITRVAVQSNPYGGSGEVQTWHETTSGLADTLSGRLQQYGRLARYWNGRDAENYPVRTAYANVRHEH